MLTKQDLQQIGDIVEAKARKAVQEELRPIKKEFQEIKDRIEDIEIKLDERTSELSKDIFLLRAELPKINLVSN